MPIKFGKFKDQGLRFSDMLRPAYEWYRKWALQQTSPNPSLAKLQAYLRLFPAHYMR
jgi:hypothetical protein